jgi:hypothetical protein
MAKPGQEMRTSVQKNLERPKVVLLRVMSADCNRRTAADGGNQRSAAPGTQ